MMVRGIDAVTACRMAIVHPVSDDPDLVMALETAVAASL
ncbi:CbbQ/NirQ/NorQ C-terminal domain-containing protein [Acinetobacter baumannii]